MPRDVTEEPGPSRPQLRTIRRARNSKHDVPCGPDCLVYPGGKKDHTPDGFMGEVARFLELDLKTRPSGDRTWVERKGGKRRHKGGRHRHCQRPNRFHPAGAETEVVQEGQQAAQDGEDVEVAVAAQEVPPRDEDRVYPALPPGEMRPADEVALAWRRRDQQEREVAREEALRQEERRQGQRLAIEEGRPDDEGDGLRGIRRLLTFRVTRRPPEGAPGDEPLGGTPRGFRDRVGVMRIFHVHRRPPPVR